MFKTFLFGIVLGAAMAAGLLYAVPSVDQERELSIISVAPNGGTSERFHINIPVDRVAVGAQTDASPVPPGLEWPTDPLFSDLRSEMFKIRDANDAVVGVAVRTAARQSDEDVVDWLLHLPARGSLFLSLDALPRDDGTTYVSSLHLGLERALASLDLPARVPVPLVPLGVRLADRPTRCGSACQNR